MVSSGKDAFAGEVAAEIVLLPGVFGGPPFFDYSEHHSSSLYAWTPVFAVAEGRVVEDATDDLVADVVGVDGFVVPGFHEEGNGEFKDCGGDFTGGFVKELDVVLAGGMQGERGGTLVKWSLESMECVGLLE